MIASFEPAMQALSDAQLQAKTTEFKERLAKGKLSPNEMFRTSEYTEWDDKGLPTKDKEGM